MSKQFVLLILLLLFTARLLSADFTITSTIKENPQHFGIQLLDSKEKFDENGEVYSMLIIYCETKELNFINDDFLAKTIPLYNAYVLLFKNGADYITISNSEDERCKVDFDSPLIRGKVYEMSVSAKGETSDFKEKFDYFISSVDECQDSDDKESFKISFSLLKDGKKTLFYYKVFPPYAAVLLDNKQVFPGVTSLNYTDTDVALRVVSNLDLIENSHFISFSLRVEKLNTCEKEDRFPYMGVYGLRKNYPVISQEGRLFTFPMFSRHASFLHNGNYKLVKLPNPLTYEEMFSQNMYQNNSLPHDTEAPQEIVEYVKPTLIKAEEKTPKVKNLIVKAVINTQGIVSDCYLFTKSAPELKEYEDAAIECVKNCTFKPLKYDKYKKTQEVLIPVSFQ
ncbi:MAG: hypothetical protein JXR56_01830 [Candidatus Cloacimonetes bacterium]|nr:hypothetical protein [Candidatus Cloacimonadota bacterium]